MLIWFFSYFYSFFHIERLPAKTALSYICMGTCFHFAGDYINDLCNGFYDERFQADKEFFGLVFNANCIFSDKSKALAATKKQKIDYDCYVLELSCSSDQIDRFRAKGTFSKQIVKIINAETDKEIFLNKHFQDVSNNLALFWQSAPLEICAEVVSNFHPNGKLVYPNNQPC